MNLALDFGNSTTKAAVFNQRKLVRAETHLVLTEKMVGRILKKYPVESSIISSVVSHSRNIEKFLRKETQYIKLTSSIPVPIRNFYESPGTLGMDRLASVVGAHSLFPEKNILVISAGTCITYDVITSGGEYFGGNITPGLDMRLRAMNTFTARLPLVKKKMTRALFGKTTAASMLTGAVKGAALEMLGFIAAYKKEYPPLKAIITGGDAPYFETTIAHRIPSGKNKTFAIPHLVLYGLNEILLLNDAKA